MEQVIQDDNQCSYDELPESEDDTDEAKVHKAMGILRRQIIENNPKLDDFFYQKKSNCQIRSSLWSLFFTRQCVGYITKMLQGSF
ncbi:hypothetical protein DPMN_169719 [Dreissena polymorpha]|uniref:Uncharacterized protein n=1 Tax=Dreissena polymorpha TaxID=45954 RepID=A0A9D4DX23_DREPO|nr:hypothetical protein DPMN_169719 [Dreissena polymorpha]